MKEILRWVSIAPLGVPVVPTEARYRRGLEALLQDDGELGRALFGASLGVANVRAVLDGLDELRGGLVDGEAGRIDYVLVNMSEVDDRTVPYDALVFLDGGGGDYTAPAQRAEDFLAGAPEQLGGFRKTGQTPPVDEDLPVRATRLETHATRRSIQPRGRGPAPAGTDSQGGK